MTAGLVDEDPYTVLGLHRLATASDVRAARRRLLRIYHPDLPTGDLRRAQNISAAAALLLDPTRRAAFDRAAPAPPPQRHRAGPGAARPAPPPPPPRPAPDDDRVSRSTRHRAADRARAHPPAGSRRTSFRRRIRLDKGQASALALIAVIAAALAGPVGIALGFIASRQRGGRRLGRVAMTVGTAWTLFMACSGALLALSY